MTLTMERPVIETPVTGNFRTWEHGTVTVVETPREIDILNSPLLRDELLVAAMRTTTVIVDMRRTSICDSTTLGVLAAASQELGTADGELRVVSSNRVMLRCMRATGDDQRFRVFASFDEALASDEQPPAVPRLRRSWHQVGLRLTCRRR